MRTSPPYRPRLVDEYLDELLLQLSGVLVVGPRAAGKTTMMSRRAATVVRLDREAQAAAFEADPDAALDGLPEPVLLDEWQNVPGVLGAARRAIETDSRPNRVYLTGSVRAEIDSSVWPATGRLVRISIYPMTLREQVGLSGGPTFFDKLADGTELEPAADTPDLRGYVRLALRSGFPTPAIQLKGRSREAWLESYIGDLLTHDIEQLEPRVTKRRDPQRLRAYLEAYALNSAGITEHKRIFDAAGVSRDTANAYEHLLENLLIIERLPAWATNRVRRLVRQPKRYLIDAALMAAVLRLDEGGLIADGNLLGRLLDTFVVAQLRPEARLSHRRPRLHHLRTEHGEHEVDLVAELGGDRVIAIEIKATASPDPGDARHLIWLRDQLGARFLAGLVLHSGPSVFELGDRVLAAPISAIWA